MAATGNNNADVNVRVKVTTQVDKSGVQDLTDQLSGASEAGDALEQVSEAADHVGESLADAGKEAAGATSKAVRGAAAGASSIGGMTKAVKTMTTAWEAFSTAAGRFFGVIGLFQQIIGLATQLYDYLTSAEREREEAARQAAEEEKTRAEALVEQARKATQAWANAHAGEEQQRGLAAVLNRYQEISEELRRQLDYTRKKIELEQGLQDDQADIERYQLDERYARGEITADERDRERERIDLESRARRRQANEQAAAEELNALEQRKAVEERHFNSLNDLIKEEIDDPRIMTGTDYTAAAAELASIRVAIREERENTEAWLASRGRTVRPLVERDKRRESEARVARMQERAEAIESDMGDARAALVDRGFSPGYTADSYASAAAEYEKVRQAAMDQLDKSARTLEELEQSTLDAADALDRLRRQNESEAEVDKAQASASKAQRDRAEADRQAAEAKQAAKSLGDSLREAQRNLAASDRQLSGTQRDVEAQSKNIVNYAKERGNVKGVAMVNDIMEMVRSGGGVDSGEEAQMVQLLKAMQESAKRLGSTEGGTMIINLLQTILNQMVADQAEKQKFADQVANLAQQLKALKQRESYRGNQTI